MYRERERKRERERDLLIYWFRHCPYLALFIQAVC